MLEVLLAALGVYLAGCYAYGVYLVARLFAARRVRQTLTGEPRRRVIRPTSRQEPKALVTAARAELDDATSGEQRIAA